MSKKSLEDLFLASPDRAAWSKLNDFIASLTVCSRQLQSIN